MTPAWALHEGDARVGLRALPDKSVQCVVTSIPYYGLRAYGTMPQVWGGRADCGHAWTAGPKMHKGGPHGDGVLVDGGRGVIEAQAAVRDYVAGETCASCGAWRGELGLEPTPQMYVQHVVEVFEDFRRVLRDDGTLWLNVGDSYAGAAAGGNRGVPEEWARPGRGESSLGPKLAPGLKPKDLIGIPWRCALALQDAGWWLRSDVIWAKPNGMPESVTDRPTRGHEYVFLLTKSETYYYDADALREKIVDYEARRRKREAKRGVEHSFKLKVEGQPHEPSQRSTLNSVSVRADHAAAGRNARTVWNITTSPSDWEYCLACDTMYDGPRRRRIRVLILDADGKPRAVPDDWWTTDEPAELGEGEREVRVCPTCQRDDAWVAHFALFPPELPERCILAGTSQHGACAACLTPWERVTEKDATGRLRGGKTPRHVPGLGDVQRKPWRTDVVYKTVGWAPRCDCDTAAVVPCTVLDPFAGSGTTLRVALDHGRRAIGIELNPAYAKLARTRIMRESPAATARRLDAFGGAEA